MNGPDYVVAVTVASEVPPVPKGGFTAPMIPLAIRAVCDVMRNRAADPRFPHTTVEVALQPKQFSCVGQPYWYHALAGTWFPTHVLRCITAWLNPILPPVAPGALYYFSPVSMVPLGSVPHWVEGKTLVATPGIDPHYFQFFK